ncbi:MAG: hypothetical protein HC824_12520 [Synechococcales cyanobacterium RM1_1_8]|nr:hypothetical protein [Synechococcales cyanobacterium RM1_1_8]
MALLRDRRLPHPSPKANRPRQAASALIPRLAFSLVLGLGGAALPTLLQPAPAQAYVAQMAVSIDNGGSSTYETLVRRAEQIARAAAQRSFDNDILVSEVAVTVTANAGGLETPVLSLNVSRSQWRGEPNPKRWATYYPMSKGLLGFGGDRQ